MIGDQPLISACSLLESGVLEVHHSPPLVAVQQKRSIASSQQPSRKSNGSRTFYMNYDSLAEHR
ncbi:hypothetical protein PIB30_054903, partial [Stylosanthes scabra]|nr:hypothetical protein [Stylosanthes scabra]